MPEDGIIQNEHWDDALACRKRGIQCPMVIKPEVTPVPNDCRGCHFRLWHIVTLCVKW
jgi:hypothetical protein